MSEDYECTIAGQKEAFNAFCGEMQREFPEQWETVMSDPILHQVLAMCHKKGHNTAIAECNEDMQHMIDYMDPGSFERFIE